MVLRTGVDVETGDTSRPWLLSLAGSGRNGPSRRKKQKSSSGCAGPGLEISARVDICTGYLSNR